MPVIPTREANQRAENRRKKKEQEQNDPVVRQSQEEAQQFIKERERLSKAQGISSKEASRKLTKPGEAKIEQFQTEAKSSQVQSFLDERAQPTQSELPPESPTSAKIASALVQGVEQKPGDVLPGVPPLVTPAAIAGVLGLTGAAALGAGGGATAQGAATISATKAAVGASYTARASGFLARSFSYATGVGAGLFGASKILNRPKAVVSDANAGITAINRDVTAISGDIATGFINPLEALSTLDEHELALDNYENTLLKTQTSLSFTTLGVEGVDAELQRIETTRRNIQQARILAAEQQLFGEVNPDRLALLQGQNTNENI